MTPEQAKCVLNHHFSWVLDSFSHAKEAWQTLNSLEGVQVQPPNSSSMQCTCGYVRTSGKGKIYRVDNEFGKCKVHCIL